jgi:hypothetical protein
MSENDQDERERLAAEHVRQLLAELGVGRSDLHEIMDSLRWIKEHREFMRRLQTGSITAIISLCCAAVASAIWVGIKTLLGGR